MTSTKGTLEVHGHAYIGEARREDIEHSHEGGECPHRHQHSGPAHYTIDKDEWLRTTGLEGGGRKRFTAKPIGAQVPLVEIAPEDNTYRVIFVDDYAAWEGAGVSPERFAAERAAFVADMACGEPRGYVPARLAQTFGMTPTYEMDTPGDGEGGRP